MDNIDPITHPEGDEFKLRQSMLLKQLQQQQRARTQIRQEKLRITIIGYLLILIFFGFLQTIGIAVFTQGFLLSRQVLPNISSCNSSAGFNPCFDEPEFNKTVFLVVDALRFDFTIPVKDSDEYFHNNFPILYDTAISEPEHSFLLKFISDAPTTTLQRLKGLTTGSLPTFVDAGSNFNGDAIDEDNWVLQLYQNNKSIAFMGDDTWVALFEKYFNPNINFPYDSLNVGDLHTVDNGVIEHLFPLFEENSPYWDIAVGHFLGVDHVGHRFGPQHYTMKQKLNQMNEVIRDVMSRIDDSTLLVVIGDHGMDSTGNHGGDAIAEVETTLFMYSKRKKFQRKSSFENQYNIENVGKDYRSVNQIDLVPTISLLLGLPIPFNNLGFPIEEAFSSQKKVVEASFKTINQLNTFRRESKEFGDSRLLDQKFDDIITLYEEKATKGEGYEELIKISKEYQAIFLEECRSLWAKFDLYSIFIGIVLLILSLLFIITYSRAMPPVRLSTMSFEFIGSIVAMSLLGVVSSFSISVVLAPEGFTLKKCISIGIALGISVGLWAPIMDKFSVEWIFHQVIDFFEYNLNAWSFLGLLFVTLHLLAFASNSYLVWEDRLVSFLISTFGFSALVACVFSKSLSRTNKILGVSHSFTFIIFSRLSSMITICREEQGDYCKNTFQTSWWSILLLYAIALILPEIVKAFFNLSDSYHSAAPIWIGGGFRYMLLMNAFYWTIEYLESNENLPMAATLKTMEPIIKSFKLAIARLVLFISIVIGTFFWYKGPLCITIDKSSSKIDKGMENTESIQQNAYPKILGYRNSYGSFYFLLVLNFSVAIMLVMKPLGAVAIAMLLVQILSLLELFNTLNIRHNLISPILLALLGFQHFFSSGHQATIPSIQWETGFMTTESIIMPFTHINIILNTFGSFIIVCLSIPLITLWKLPPTSKPITALSYVLTNSTTYLAYHTLIGLSSIIFATHFRRHLMVWKIFAPRYMLSGLLIILTNAALITLSLWLGTNKTILQVNRIFGK